MGLTFRDSDADKGQEGRLRRVPDYSSRPVKLRLFVLLAALMLVLYVAERARDPKSWQWFFLLDQQPPPEQIDNRLPPKMGRTDGEPVGTVVIAGEDRPDDAAAPAAHKPAVAAPRFDPLAKAWTEGLGELWSQLSSDERTLLYRMLEDVQDKKILPDAQREAAASLVAALDQRWTEYHVAAYQSVAQLEGEDQARWTGVLQQINSRFSDEVKASLETFAGGRTVLPDQEQSLARLLEDLTALNLRRVQDDTPFLHPSDNQIWHHLFWQLRRSDDAALADRSMGEVAYAQLYRQPAQYRGQVVTVRGAARWAYRVRASHNQLGIKEYFVFWLQPFESADTPLVVYALAPPHGFPTLKDRNRDGEMTVLNEALTVHGFLFKRGAYAGRGEIYNAPLLLARTPQWKPEPLTMRVTEAQGSQLVWRAAIVAFFASALIAAVVYWTTFRRVRPAPLKDELAIAAALRNLKDADVLPSPEESLRQIEREAQGADGDRPPA